MLWWRMNFLRNQVCLNRRKQSLKRSPFFCINILGCMSILVYLRGSHVNMQIIIVVTYMLLAMIETDYMIEATLYVSGLFSWVWLWPYYLSESIFSTRVLFFFTSYNYFKVVNSMQVSQARKRYYCENYVS